MMDEKVLNDTLKESIDLIMMLLKKHEGVNSYSLSENVERIKNLDVSRELISLLINKAIEIY